MDMGTELRIIEVEEFDDSELTDAPEPAETPIAEPLGTSERADL